MIIEFMRFLTVLNLKVICDEGHIIKNPSTTTSRALHRVKTSRRIILTGTPMQNNLMECKRMKFLKQFTANEYASSSITDHAMIHFVKPYILRTRGEFSIDFAIPIRDGQYSTSTFEEIQEMKTMSYVLHKTVMHYVQVNTVVTIKIY